MTFAATGVDHDGGSDGDVAKDNSTSTDLELDDDDSTNVASSEEGREDGEKDKISNDMIAVTNENSAESNLNQEQEQWGQEHEHEHEKERIKFLIEIVGCEDLPSTDFFASDPYVVVKFNDQILHETEHFSKTLNPIFTLRKGAFFEWEVSAEDLLSGQSKGLQLNVYDYDAWDSDDEVCMTFVPGKDLYNANGERLTYSLHDPWFSIDERSDQSGTSSQSYFQLVSSKQAASSAGGTKGKISIRCRRATNHDEEFMKTFKENTEKRKLTGVLNKKESQRRRREKHRGRGDKGIALIQSILETKLKHFFHEDGEKILKHKALPGPDPDDLTGTEWLTEEEVEKAYLQPSRQYHYVGSGKIARVYLEILGCDGLPNMEFFQKLGNKTDAFVQVVYEDCVCQTDVIYDKNSPRFLPWSKRAFVLHSKYPSSVINLGVFDFNPGVTVLTDHALIGRAAVDVTNLRPGTEYMLNYALYESALKTERVANGSIKIRIRVEIDDPRAYLLANLKAVSAPTIYVNSGTYKNSNCVRRTIFGKYDMNKFSLDTVIDLLCELAEHGRITYYIKGALLSLLLWRSTYEISVFGKEFKIPLNSMYTFLMAITLVEKPSLLPPFTFLTLGWVLTISMQSRNDHPNPWRNCPTFREFLLLMLLGKRRPLSPEVIAAYRDEDETKQYDQPWGDLVARAEERKAELAAEIAKEEEELQKQLKEAGGDNKDITSLTNDSGINRIRVLTRNVYPIQKTLLSICEVIRFIRNILLWEESVLSFWVTFASFALSLVFFFVPWGLIFLWVGRVAVWTLFGPWMKFIDLVFFQDEHTEAENRSISVGRKVRKEAMEKTITEARIKNEQLFKLRDFRQYLFGNFLSIVPILKRDRYIDQPMASSSAKPIDTTGVAPKHGHHEAGQQLTGVMIPTIAEMDKDLQRCEVVQDDPTKKKTKMEIQSVGSVVLLTGLLTYFAGPLLSEVYLKYDTRNVTTLG